MKRLLLLLMILFCSISLIIPIAAQVENTSETITDVNSIISNNDNQSISSNTISMSTLIDIVFSTETIISCVIIVIPGLYAMIRKKDVPKKLTIIFPSVLFLCIIAARLCIINTKWSGVLITVLITVIMLIVFIYIIHNEEKHEIVIHEVPIIKNTTEKKLLGIIQREINKCHCSIECMQLYSLDEIIQNDNIFYKLDFLGGSSKKGININALFSSTMELPKEYADDWLTILKVFNDSSDDNPDAVRALIIAQITRLKDELNKLTSANQITDKDCYIARILLLYISLLAVIDNHDAFIGLTHQSLGLINSQIEPLLFSYTRTGILGGILLNPMPYVFAYCKNGNKHGRFYYCVSFGNEKKYVLLISMKNKNNQCYIDYNMSENLRNLQQKMYNELSSDTSKPETGGNDK